MALGLTARGTGVHNASATSFTLSPSGNFAARSWAVLCIAADNSSSGGSSNNFTTTATDSLGNTWTRRQTPVFDNGGANAGVQGAIYTTDQNVGLLTTGTVITVGFLNATVAKTWTLTEVTAAVGDLISVAGGFNPTGGGTGTALTTGATPAIDVGEVLVAAFFVEAGVTQTVTGDSDTTNGTWTTVQTAKVGTTTSGSVIASQGKVQTTTSSTQTYNVTLGISSDYTYAFIILHPNSATSAAAGNAAGAGLVRLPTWGPRVFPVKPAGTGAASSTTITAGLSFSPYSATFSNTVASFTNASAGSVGGIGAARQPTAKGSPSAGNAAGTGAARQPAPGVIIWGSYSSTFSNGVGITTVSAGLASGTGSTISVGSTKSAAAPRGTGTGTTFAGTTSVLTVDAIIATGTGAANDAAARTVAAGLASGTGAANNTTVSTSAAVNVTAGLASGTGATSAPAVSMAPAPARATGTGDLTTSAKTVAMAGGLATATGTAHQTRFSYSSASRATGTGAVVNATVSTSAATNVAAGLASGTGTANSPTTLSASTAAAGLAFGTGLAGVPTKAVSPAGGAATGTGTVNPTVMQFVALSTATGTGTANDASATAGSSVSVPGGLATGTGAANDATVPAVTNVRPTNAAGVAFAFEGFKTLAVGPSSNINGTGSANLVGLSGRGPSGGQPPQADATHAVPGGSAKHPTPTR